MKGLFFSSLLVGTSFALPTSEANTDTVEVSLSNIKPIFTDAKLSTRDIRGKMEGRSFADPTLIYGEGSWKAYGTSNGHNIPYATAQDGFNFTYVGDALKKRPSWATTAGLWAPDVVKLSDGSYVLYFSGVHKDGKRCIGAATSKTSAGGFEPYDKALVCDHDNGGVIDAAGFFDGKDRWLTWKVDGNGLGGATTCKGGSAPTGPKYKPTPLKVQKMTADGLSVVGSPTTIWDNRDNNPNAPKKFASGETYDDDGVTENPALYKSKEGKFFLFYSSHCYANSKYHTEYAYADAVTGPFKWGGVVIATGSKNNEKYKAIGPGGFDIDPNGKNVVFHGRQGSSTASRITFSGTVEIKGTKVTL
ncbi:hypothetical protein V2G26_010217 [Clonostachys chloroleuca]